MKVQQGCNRGSTGRPTRADVGPLCLQDAIKMSLAKRSPVLISHGTSYDGWSRRWLAMALTVNWIRYVGSVRPKCPLSCILPLPSPTPFLFGQRNCAIKACGPVSRGRLLGSLGSATQASIASPLILTESPTNTRPPIPTPYSVCQQRISTAQGK